MGNLSLVTAGKILSIVRTKMLLASSCMSTRLLYYASVFIVSYWVLQSFKWNLKNLRNLKRNLNVYPQKSIDKCIFEFLNKVFGRKPNITMGPNRELIIALLI